MMTIINDVDVDLFGAKPFTVPTPQTPPAVVASGDVFGMPVFIPVSPNSTFDQEMIDIQVFVLCCVCSVSDICRWLC